MSDELPRPSTTFNAVVKRILRQMMSVTRLLLLLAALAVITLIVRSYSRSDTISLGHCFAQADHSRFVLIDCGDDLGHLGVGVSEAYVPARPGLAPYVVDEVQRHLDAKTGLAWKSHRVLWLVREIPLTFEAGHSSWPFIVPTPHKGAFDDIRVQIRVGYVGFPLWVAAILLSFPSALHAAIAFRRRRRVKAGCCTNCGYDLRGTPERCPECGTRAAAK